VSERAAGGRIAVLGLGRMGLPVAGRLASRMPPGAVTGFDPVAKRRAAASAAGLDVAASADAAVRGADVLVLVLPGAAEVEELVAGAEGASILDLLVDGATVLDLTSTDPRVAERAARAMATGRAGPTGGAGRVGRAGDVGRAVRAGDVGRAGRVGWVAAPMGGGVAGAGSGGLTLYVGGTPGDVERVRPLLDALADPVAGGRVELAGAGPGDGCTAKLLVNALWFGQVAAAAEALQIGRERGLDPSRLVGLLARSAAGGAVLEGYGQAIVDDEPLAVFGLDRVVEELEIVRGLAADAGTDARIAELVARLHREAVAEFGPVDGELLVARLIARRSARPGPATPDHATRGD
jgi:3-hydroxyisobutyrate dehydrogenase-like beta-hydroxyacid dehydrogenase